MSSPLSLFRKYQYVFLVVLGVILMFAFVIAPPIADYLTQKQIAATSDNNVVVTWVGGDVREADLTRMQRNHFAAIRFLYAVRAATELPDRDFQMNNNGRFVRYDKNGRALFVSPAAAQSEEDLVQKLFRARKAASMGIVIDDNAIAEYLGRLILDTPVRSEQLNEILDQVNPRDAQNQISVQELFDQLRIELAADRIEELLALSPLVSTPAEDREYFDRLNRRVKVELLPLPVNDYLNQVAEPSEAEIAALYEKHKNDFRNPYSPDPGFRRRLRISFAYVKATLAPYVEEELPKAKEKITAAEIEKYYKENAHLFRVRETNEEVPPEPRPRGAETNAADNTPPSEPAKTPTTDTPDSNSPSAEQPTETQEESPADSGAEEGPNPNAGDPQEPSAEAPSDSGTDAPVSPETPQSRRAIERRESRLVSFSPAGQDNQDAPATDSTDGDDPPDAASAENAASDSESPQADDAPPTPGQDSPQADASPEPETSGGDDSPTTNDSASDSPTTAGDKDGSSKPPTSQPATERPLRPLDDALRAEIREERATANARQAARARVDEALQKIEKEARTYSREYSRWKSRGHAEGEPEPAPLDAEALAKKYGLPGKPGLVAGTTGLLDAIDVGETELGKSFTFNSQTFQQVTFPALAYNEKTALFSPGRIGAIVLDTEFCFWKTNEELAHVPDLADVRTEVIQAWKKNRAVVLAKEDAEKKASQTRDAKKSLKELFENEKTKVVETDEFSWLSYGNIAPGAFNPPRLSEVTDVEAAGQDFMKAVFALDEGGAGVAWNEPQTMVYVVRVVDDVKSTKELDEEFFEGLRQGVTDLAMQNRFEITGQWFREIDKEMKVTWIRDPRYFGEQ